MQGRWSICAYRSVSLTAGRGQRGPITISSSSTISAFRITTRRIRREDPGTFTYSPPAGTVLGVGTHTLSVASCRLTLASTSRHSTVPSSW